MTGVSIQVDLKGRADIAAALGRLSRRVEDMRPAFDQIGASLTASTLKRFEDQKGPDGQPWKPLSADTILARLGGTRRTYTKGMKFRKGVAAKIGALKILQDKGRLKASITWRAASDRVEIGSNLVYAAIQQLGGQAGRGVTIPARPFLGIDDSDKNEIGRIVENYLGQIFRGRAL